MEKYVQLRPKLRRLFRRTAAGERGVTMIEFALVLPFLVVLFIGLVEFAEAFTVMRKLSMAAHTVSDLVAQEPSVDTAELNDVSLVADEILKPYGTAPLTIVIVSVVSDVDNAATVAWSHPASAYVPGTAYALPEAALTDPNTSLIVAEATYDFTPTVSRFLGSFQMNERGFFRPRFTQTVLKLD